MVFGGVGWGRAKPEFYPMTEGPLPLCLTGSKAPLPGHSSDDISLQNPILIKDNGKSMFIQFPISSTGMDNQVL